MKKFIIQSLPLLASLLGLVLVYFTYDCINSGCDFQNFIRLISEEILRPLGNFSLFSVLGLAVLPFVSPAVFRTAIKFVIGWTIGTVVLVAITQTNSNSYLPIFDPEKASVALVMGALLSLITIIIVVRKSFFAKK